MAPRKNASRKRPWGVVVRAGAAVVVLAICFFGTTFMSPEEAEAVLTALLGGLIGVALGAAIGLAGVAALMGTQAGSGLNLQLPWPALIGILLASAAVGVLASLRPAGRAAAIAPVAALATD